MLGAMLQNSIHYAPVVVIIIIITVQTSKNEHNAQIYVNNHTDKYSPAILSLKSENLVRCTTSDGSRFHSLIALGKHLF